MIFADRLPSYFEKRPSPNPGRVASVLLVIFRRDRRSSMKRHGYFERYWCPVLTSGALTFIASIVTAPLWR